MSLTADQLRSIPLLRGFPDEHLDRLRDVFECLDLAEGETLFEAGQPAEAFYLLASGEVSVYKDDEVRFRLRPPAPVAELGTLADLKRNTTAKATQPSEVWRVSRDTLLDLLHAEADIARRFYQDFLGLLADKVLRDQIRLEDMRTNIIRTQKAMKRMRDLVLEAPETPISEPLHDELDGLIEHNRRVNYRVRPPATLPAELRDDDGSLLPVIELSRTHLSYVREEGSLPEAGDRWRGVLCLSGPEIPITARVLRVIERRVTLELGLLIEDYVAELEGYLTRTQMLDFML